VSSTDSRAVLVGGLSMLRSFAGLKIPTVVISRYTRDVGRYSRYCNDWRTTFLNSDWNEPYFLETLIGIANEGPDMPVLYYGDDPMLRFILNHRDTLQAHYRFTMPDSEILEACYDKIKFSALADQHALPTPKTLTSAVNPDTNLIANQIGFPCVIKPATCTGWSDSKSIRLASKGPQKVLVANDAAECKFALDAMQRYSGNFVIQEYIPGGEENIYSFHTYVPKSGNVELWYVGKKIRTFPAIAGESAYVELVNNPDLATLGFETVEKLKLRGPVKIDFKKDPRTNEFMILEINLRYNLWNHLGTYCGINLPLAAYRDNNELPQPAAKPYRIGVGWLHFGRDLRSFATDYYPNRQLSIRAWLASLCRPKVCYIFSWKDPLPFMMHSLGSLRRLPQKLFGGVL